MGRLKVAILGIGLIGGSFGLCLKDKLKENVYLTGTSHTQASMEAALRCGAVDFASADLQAVVEDADFVYLSTPVLQMIPLVQKIRPFLKEGAILTDAGSTKAWLHQQMQALLPAGVYYVAGHPMTGKEKSGVKAAHKDLFRKKCYVLIEDPDLPSGVWQKTWDLLRFTEANLTTMDLQKHDRCAAIISHIPHVTAAALVHLLNHNLADLPTCEKLAGGGFKDTTRIASSNADMWADICMTNPEAIVTELQEMQGIFSHVIEAIEARDRMAVHDYFAAAKKRRDAVLDTTEKMFEI